MLNKAFKYSPHEDTDHTGVYMHNHKHVLMHVCTCERAVICLVSYSHIDVSYLPFSGRGS